ncbi:hypothetical protein Purlil1_2232 [Purpureocillium lilacinum]|uniref:Uncharacterized protein n=1 Tax=Purpureocillium lilacinum TaxID=33203 RepID=A0ABR0CA14_PURLI|nr:hypothetical protein Purlil1_2232 [Purpureocillium lilacinum]
MQLITTRVQAGRRGARAQRRHPVNSAMSSIAGNVELSSLKNAPVGKELCSGARDWTAGAAGWKEDGRWLKLNSGGPSWDLTFALPLPRLDGGVEEPRHVPDPLMRGDGSLMFRWWCVWLVDNSGYEYLNLVQMSSSHHAPSPVTTACRKPSATRQSHLRWPCVRGALRRTT